MKKCRGIIAGALVLATLFAMSTTAFAADLTQDDPSGDATSWHKVGQTISDNGTPDDPSDDTVGGTYLVTIPEFIEVADVNGAMNEEDVTAKNVLIPQNTNLTVDVEFEPTLSLRENDEVKLAYDMKVDGSKVNSGDTIMTVAAGDPDAETTVKIGAVLTQEPDYAGVYLDTATFSIAVA